ncbi:hypothetical protein CRG98_040044 [Punica granatum]|uniref:Retroviral polymerase SH3-like domain-containing protein n=1 Tax=Punica granatum TaxID=22663 RepID=A0A2I0I6D9_PUNGR|nr:hypothetical protein CRG98_040044 [Punica granatum]
MEAGLSSFSALAPPVWGDLSSFGSENASLSRGCDYLEAARNNIRIMACESAKAIWDFLKAEYQGDERIKSIKVPNLIREFKRLQMDESETIMEYSDKLIGIAKKVRFAKLVSALQAPERGRSMRLEGSVEGALKAKLQQHSGGKEKKWKGRKGMAVAHRQLQEKVKRDKLGEKVEPSVFVGHSLVSKAYKIYQPKTGKRCSVAVLEPAGFEEAKNDQRWMSAIKEELAMIEKNQTWELGEKPKDKKIIGLKRVFRTKLNPDGSVNKPKTMLFLNCARELHMVAAKRVLRYLKGTLSHGIKFCRAQEFKL